MALGATIFFWKGLWWKVTLLLCLEPPKPLPIAIGGAIPLSGTGSRAKRAKNCYKVNDGNHDRAISALTAEVTRMSKNLEDVTLERNAALI